GAGADVGQHRHPAQAREPGEHGAQSHHRRGPAQRLRGCSRGDLALVQAHAGTRRRLRARRPRSSWRAHQVKSTKPAAADSTTPTPDAAVERTVRCDGRSTSFPSGEATETLSGKAPVARARTGNLSVVLRRGGRSMRGGAPAGNSSLSL